MPVGSSQIPIGLAARATKPCTVEHDIFSIMTSGLLSLHTNVCNVTCLRRKEPNTCEVCRSLQNCRSCAWYLIHITLLAPIIWKCRLHFWKTCAHVLVSSSSI